MLIRRVFKNLDFKTFSFGLTEVVILGLELLSHVLLNSIEIIILPFGLIQVVI